MQERMEGKLGDHHSGAMRLKTADAKAERIIKEELARLGWMRGSSRCVAKTTRRSSRLQRGLRRH